MESNGLPSRIKEGLNTKFLERADNQGNQGLSEVLVEFFYRAIALVNLL